MTPRIYRAAEHMLVFAIRPFVTRLPKSVLSGTLVLAAALSIAACHREAKTGGITLTWVPPAEYEDGSTLSANSLTAYRVYVDRRLVATVDPERTQYFLELPAGEYDVTVSAVAKNMESRPSEARRVRIP
jgi:hypothetical protein